MANTISAKNRNAKPLFNIYKESEKGELVSDMYGFTPSNIWNVKKTKQLVEYVSDTFAMGSYTKGQKKKKGQQKLSLLPPDIAMRVIKYYTLPNDNVYDPFSNRGVGSMIAYLAGRNGYCTEIVPTYVEDMKKRFARAKEDIKSDNILEVKLGDARKSPYADEMFDLVYTSPPFPLCLLSDTNIITKDGVKKICDIVVGDKVLTHNGSYEKVTKTMSRAYTGDMVGIKTWKNNETLYLTPNHKILVYRDNKKQWVKAEDLTCDDYFLYKSCDDVVDIDKIDLSHYYQGRKVEKNKIYCGANQYGSVYIKRFIELNEDVLELFGYFVADGYADAKKGHITFTLGRKTKCEIKDHIIDVVKKYFDIDCSVSDRSNYEVDKKDAFVVTIYSKALAITFRQMFYDDYKNKIVPNFIMNLPIEKQMQFFCGYWECDGTYSHNSYSYTTCSITLSEQLFHLLLRFGIASSKNYIYADGGYIKGRYVNRKNCITTSIFGEDINKFNDIVGYDFVPNKKYNRYNNGRTSITLDDGYIGYKINDLSVVNISDVSDVMEVYNLEVDKYSSYTTYFGCVHNCIEQYESVDGQLTDISDYKEFMNEMFLCIKEAYRVTKYGGFTIWQVNDARRNGKFYNIHGDFCKLLRKAGFVQHDFIVNQLNSASMTSIGQIEKLGSKIMPKSTEYLLVFKKPYKEGKYKGKHRFEKMALEAKEKEE